MLSSGFVKTLLLLAGRSRRFWPLAEKSLWPFLGKPLLQHQVDRLHEGGLRDITLVGGQHNLEQVEGVLPGFPMIEQENLDLGMRGALLSALPSLKGEPVCIVSGNDVIESGGYAALLEASRLPGVDGAILAQRVKRYFPGGYLVMAPESGSSAHPRIAGIVEKPGEGKEPSDLVTIVAHIHNHPERLLEVLEDVSSARDDAYEVALTALCRELHYVAVPYEGPWHAVKYPWHILDLTGRFLSELQEASGLGLGLGLGLGSGNAVIHPTAVVEGPVVFGDGVKVLPHATVQGPCFIGRGSVIGTNALVRESIIGERCVIGFGSEVVRSHLSGHVWTHTTYLGDSVVGRNVAFGAGTVAANFRLDEGEIASVVGDEKVPTERTKLGVVIGDDVRVGINVSFAPGVKVGRRVFVNSATFIDRDIPEGQYVKVVSGELEMRENAGRVPPARG